MWSAQGSKKIQSFNFVTISSEHYFCSSGVYTFGTTLKDKASKRVLWLIVRHECDFTVCIVILSPISTAWESKSSITKKKKKSTAALFLVTAVLSCSQMGQSFSNLLMDIHLGMPTSQAWWQMVHGVITWYSMVRRTALKRVFTWSAVCRIIMT